MPSPELLLAGKKLFARSRLELDSSGQFPFRAADGVFSQQMRQ